MKELKRFSLTAVLLSASTAAFAHPGHEAIGDLLHVEHLFAAGILIVAVLSTWKVKKRRR
ncbi:hypothetical protein [Marinobacter salarius]|uniref:hypothetical protein n=1 Tax=Marinobacter salarius TaxID=1420917 RepID=UPI00321350A4